MAGKKDAFRPRIRIIPYQNSLMRRGRSNLKVTAQRNHFFIRPFLVFHKLPNEVSE